MGKISSLSQLAAREVANCDAEFCLWCYVGCQYFTLGFNIIL